MSPIVRTFAARTARLWLLALLVLSGCASSSRDAELAPVPEKVLQADRRFFRGDVAGAMHLLEQAAQEDPRSFHAIYRLGVCSLFADPSAAPGRLEQAGRLAPTHPGPVFFIALTHLRTGDVPAARPWVDRARALRNARIAERYAARDTSDALRTGLAALDARRFGDASVAFRGADVAHPDDPAVVYLEALALYRGGSPAAALPVVDRALRLRPRFPDADALRGLCLLRLERREEARTIADEVRAASPHLADGFYLAGMVDLDASEYHDSFLAFWDAILEDPMVAEYYVELGQNLIRFGQNDVGSWFLQFMEWTALVH